MAPAVVAEADGFDSYITGLRAHATPAALLRLHPGAYCRDGQGGSGPARAGAAGARADDAAGGARAVCDGELR